MIYYNSRHIQQILTYKLSNWDEMYSCLEIKRLKAHRFLEESAWVSKSRMWGMVNPPEKP